MKIYQGANNLSAWQNVAADLLQNGGELFNTIVEIANPVQLDNHWLKSFDPAIAMPAADSISDVVNFIFPRKLERRCHRRAELYHRYLDVHDRARKLSRNRGSWGTYFERLVRFGPRGPNQLETIIQKLSTWEKVTKSAFVFHLSAPHLDRPRTRGGPCWQFGEIIWHPNNEIDLVVVYRAHDYFNKALGNFIGLGQLLQFIARECNKRPGKLVCHSVRAYNGSTQTALKNLARL